MPLFAAVFHSPWWLIASLLLFLLLMQWFVTLLKFSPLPEDRLLRLETISASHFVEKVRWSIDRLGLPYRETANGGTLGAFFTGRTVPKLHIPTGKVISTIGNSSDILRYLWGRYGNTPEYESKAKFLEPTPEATALEEQLDGYGVDLQRWFYANGLSHRKLMMRVWGLQDPFVPFFQRCALWLLYPILCPLVGNAFHIRAKTGANSATRIAAFLGKMEKRLEDGRTYVLGGAELTYIDIALAALSGIWVFPTQYGNGRAEHVLPKDSLLPPRMRQDIADWKTAFPKVYAHILNLYQNDRMTSRTPNEVRPNRP